MMGTIAIVFRASLPKQALSGHGRRTSGKLLAGGSIVAFYIRGDGLGGINGWIS